MKVVELKNETGADVATGIDKKARKAIAGVLSRQLAGTYTLALKTLNYHWNVTGPHFNSLHAMFQEQYAALLPAVDELAERIRTLGFAAPGTYREFAGLSSVTEDKAAPANWQAMVKNLLAGHEQLARDLRKDLPMIQKGSDESTADLFITRMEFHEKTAWMLRSLLGK
jgi:starvation-inducible DNA-binding protein